MRRNTDFRCAGSREQRSLYWCELVRAYDCARACIIVPCSANHHLFCLTTTHNDMALNALNFQRYSGSAPSAQSGLSFTTKVCDDRCSNGCRKALGLYTHPKHSSLNPTSSDPGHLGTTGRQECPNRSQSKSETVADLSILPMQRKGGNGSDSAKKRIKSWRASVLLAS